MIPLLLVGVPFCFPFARFFSPCSSTSRESPEVAARTPQELGPSIVYSPKQFIVSVVLAELPFLLTPRLHYLLLAHKASIAHCFQKNSSSFAKGTLNLLVQLSFSNTSYLTEWRKFSDSSRTTSCLNCNILIFSWLLQTSLTFSRIWWSIW